MSNLKKYSDETIAAARKLYMDYKAPTEIMKVVDIKTDALSYYMRKWKTEREQQKHEILDALTESKKELMFRISQAGLAALARAMEDLQHNPKPLTPGEMRNIAAIVDSVDKIVKLDDGDPTEISATLKPATVVEMRNLLAKDPFETIEEIEYVEKSED